MDNMTIGASVPIGGNTVQMRKDGKFQVINSKGKIKTLTQDEFKKNWIKNAEKIENGEDFEFKKDYSKGLKIAAAAVGTAAVTAGIIYRKEIGKYLRNFSFKKLWQDIKGMFKSRFDKNAPAGWSREERHARRDALKETFKGYDPEKGYKAQMDFLKKSKVSEEQFSLMQRILHVNAINESKMGPIEGAKLPHDHKKLPDGLVIDPIKQSSFLRNLQSQKESLDLQRSSLPENLRTNDAIAEFVEKARNAFIEGSKVYERQSLSNVDKAAEARKAFLESRGISEEQYIAIRNLALDKKVTSGSKSTKGAASEAKMAKNAWLESQKELLPEALRTKKACRNFMKQLRKAINATTETK